MYLESCFLKHKDGAFSKSKLNFGEKIVLIFFFFVNLLRIECLPKKYEDHNIGNIER